MIRKRANRLQELNQGLCSVIFLLIIYVRFAVRGRMNSLLTTDTGLNYILLIFRIACRNIPYYIKEKIPEHLYCFDFNFFFRSMSASDCRSEGNHINSFEFFEEKSAFKSGMNSSYFRFFAKKILYDLRVIFSISDLRFGFQPG